MSIVIKEIHVRTVVERKVITDTDISEVVLREIENKIINRLSENENTKSVRLTRIRKRNDR